MEPLSAGWSTTSATSQHLANVVNTPLEAARFWVRPPFFMAHYDRAGFTRVGPPRAGRCPVGPTRLKPP